MSYHRPFDRGTSQLVSWTQSDMPIRHHRASLTNHVVTCEPFSLRCAWVFYWKLPLRHFVCGWYDVATQCFTPYLSKRVLNWWLQKCFPLSLMIALGVPNHVKIFLFKNFITAAHHWKVKATTSTHFDTIIDCYQNTLIGEWWWKGAHEIHAPHIKQLNFKDVVERHLVMSRNISRPLTCITCLDISISILKQRRLIKPRLWYLCCYLDCTKMTSNFSSMAMVQNAFRLVLRHTSSHNLIRAVFVENWIIPLVVFDIC